MAIMNSLPNLDTLSQTLDEYPLQDPVTGATTTFRDSRRVNYTAQALNLIDMKTFTLGFLVEQLGLVSPERIHMDLAFTCNDRSIADHELFHDHAEFRSGDTPALGVCEW